MTGKGEKKGGKGVHGKNIAGQYRALFAKGVLRSGGKGSGKGKSKPLYNKAANATGQRNKGRGAKRTGLAGQKSNGPNTFKRVVIGGSAAAGLRSGGGSKVKPSGKRDFSATREARVAAGKQIANRPETARKALKGSGLRVKPSTLPDAGTAPLLANGSRKTGMNAKGDTRFLVRTARTTGALPPRSGGGVDRATRIAAGRKKALEFASSERGQNIQSAISALSSANRRTGRRDYGKEAKVKTAKAQLKAAGVKVKTGQALAKQYDLPRLKGDFSRPTLKKTAPKYAAQQQQAAQKAGREAKRAALLSSVQGKSRAERIAIGKAAAAQFTASPAGNAGLNRSYSSKRAAGKTPNALERAASRPSRINQGLTLALPAKAKLAENAQAKVREATRAKAQATSKRLQARENRVARGEAKKVAQTQTRLVARNKRAEKVTGLERTRRIKAGQAALAAFRQRRDRQYNGSLF